MYMVCQICNSQVKITGGALFRHLAKIHNLSYKEYIIKIKYGGVAPKCKCGFCDLEPLFFRGEFKEYAKGHKNYKFIEKEHIKKHGYPKCEECGAVVSFNRGKPRKYCSFMCSGKNTGFSLEKTQINIKNVVKEKYGVDNISKTLEVRAKISQNTMGIKHHRYGKSLSEEHKNKIRKKMKIHWFLETFVKTRKPKNHTEESKRKISNGLKKRWQSEEYRTKILSRAIFNKFSKLHLHVVEKLCLRELGFVGEQVIGRYLVDEVNWEKKVIIEINGDYVHANPRYFKNNDIIKMPGNQYTAMEKWESDEKKIKNLRKKGFKVIIIWESDDFLEKKQEILNLIK